MGATVKFTCFHCGYEKNMGMGVGMFWDLEKLFNGIVENVKNGKYGEEWEKELKKDPSLVVNISDELYICPACGSFATALNLSLYRPVNKGSSAGFQDARKYGTDLTLESNPDYQLFRAYPHLCEKCHEQMTVYSDQKGDVQPACPECGEKGKFSMDTLWD